MKNRSDSLKTIGLVVEDSFTDFSKEVIHSVAHAMIGRPDFRLVVVAGRYDGSEDPADKKHQYNLVYNTIYQLESDCQFDGMILTIPGAEGLLHGLDPKIPKVFVALEREGETTVNYDNETGIREAIEYLVNIKGVNKLCMLGGRDDNADAQKRKDIFKRCLESLNLTFDENCYEPSEMNIASEAASKALLDRNPGVQAVFCVNDQTAFGLYQEMKRRGIVPGRDVYVFGFDNTQMAGDMIPPLASVGSAEITLGQRAIELLMMKMNGKEVESATVPTRLYGRESLRYDMYQYTAMEMLTADHDFIYRMFDDCFYRYKNEIIEPGAINLRRLFFEFISRMLQAKKNRFMSEETFWELAELIEIFFDNGAMMYTDANKFVQSLGRLQGAMNVDQNSIYINHKNNRLFSMARDHAIRSQFIRRNTESRHVNNGRNRIFDFQVETSGFMDHAPGDLTTIVENFSRIGLSNAGLFMFSEPYIYDGKKDHKFSDHIDLVCVTRNGEPYVLPEERRDTALSDIFYREELIYEGRGLTAYPLFYGNEVYGFVVCGMTWQMLNMGEFYAGQLSRCIHMNQ